MKYGEAKKYILKRLREELPDHLHYHGMHHTLDILRSAMHIGKQENISAHEMQLLKTAALFHDSGFIVSDRDHEKQSCKLARQALPKFGFTKQEIEKVCGMIMATRIPQTPQNHLEEILCDADLDYLGTNEYATISSRLFKELATNNTLNEKDWLSMQVNFMEGHHYFTATAKKMRRSQKAQTLRRLKSTLNKTITS